MRDTSCIAFDPAVEMSWHCGERLSFDGAPMRCALSTVHGLVSLRAVDMRLEQMSARESELKDSGRPILYVNCFGATGFLNRLTFPV